MLPTILRWWSRCFSYFVCICGFYYRACLALLFVLVIFSPFSIVITSLGEERESWPMCFWCILFVYFARVEFLSFFGPSWCQMFATAYDCGTPWTFLLTFLYWKLILMVHRVRRVRFSLPLDISGCLRLVTMHSLEFSINYLADETLRKKCSGAIYIDEIMKINP